MMKAFLVVYTAITLCVLNGCSVYMAARQPDKKDLTVFNPGTSRGRVLAELGEPIKTCIEEGDTSDTFIFRQGYSKGARVGRGVVHAAADILTIGLWEAVGIPIEMIADGDEVQVDVRYDSEDRVKQVTAKKGAEVLSPARHATPRTVLMAKQVESFIPLAPTGNEPAAQGAQEVPTIGIFAMGQSEVLSPDIRLQWLSKTTGVGDWFTNSRVRTDLPFPKLYSANETPPAKPAPIGSFCGPFEGVCTWTIALAASPVYQMAGYLAAGAYTVYLPFATATGAIAGEIDAQRWRCCRDDFLLRVYEANPAQRITDALNASSPATLALHQDNAFETAGLLGLSTVVTVEAKAVGVKTCQDLGRFSLVLESQAKAYAVVGRTELFTESFSLSSNECLKAEAFCEESRGIFVKEEIARLARETAERVKAQVLGRVSP